MDKFIARLNIEHFRALLAGELDDAKRAEIVRLLAREEEILKTLLEDDMAKRGKS